MGWFKGNLFLLWVKNYVYYNCIYLYIVVVYKCFMFIKIYFGLIGDMLWKLGCVVNVFEGFCLYLYLVYCVFFK